MLHKLACQFIVVIVVVGLLLTLPTTILAQTGTCQNSIQHNGGTPSKTEHRMVVCGDGNIATGYGLFFKTDTQDEGKDDGLGNLTTMGFHFDQLGNNVDIGWQGDFQPVEEIRLSRPAYFGPYSEETYSRYKSKTLLYEIEQRTFTEDSPWKGTTDLGKTNNWVVMELLIRNTSTLNLTGGRLLYMADFDPGRASDKHKGFYDATTGVAYHMQQPNPGQPFSDRGFGMGIRLLSGTLLGHGLGTYPSNYPNNDNTFLTEITNPMYSYNQSIAKPNDSDRADYISWLVIEIPNLVPGAEAKITIGWCASIDSSAAAVAGLIKSCLTDKPYLPALSVQKGTPSMGYVGTNTATYTISARYNGINPNVTSLTDSAIGNIPVTGLGTYPINYTILPTMTTPLVTTITVNGNYDRNGRPTNISQTITHSLYIDFKPVISLTVSSIPGEKADVTKEMTYLITATHTISSDKSSVLSITITLSKSDSITYTGDTDGNTRLDYGETWIYEAKYSPTLADPNPLLNTITLQGWDGNNETVSAIATDTITLAYNPKLQIVKSGPDEANANSYAVFNFEISHVISDDGSPINNLIVSDAIIDNNETSVASPILNGIGKNFGDTNKNDFLDKGEIWLYTAVYRFDTNSPSPLINIGTVEGKDLDNDKVTAKSTQHTTHIIPGKASLEVTKSGPATAKVGQVIAYVIQIRHNQNSGRSPVKILIMTDTLISTPIDIIATQLEGGDYNNDGLLDVNEVFSYRVNYTVTLQSSDTLLNEVLVEGVDENNNRIKAKTTKPTVTRIEYAPVILMEKTGPPDAKVGDNITYHFNLAHDKLESDKTPVVFAPIEDSLGIYVSCSDKGNRDIFIDENETWRCSASYIVQPTVDAKLVNLAIFNGAAKDFGVITYTDSYTTLIHFAPKLTTSAGGSTMITDVGDTITYTATLAHAPDSDQSPMRQFTVIDNLGNLGTCQGDENGQLDQGETWPCIITATIPTTTTNPLTLTVTAQGIDGNDNPVPITTTQYSVKVSLNPLVAFTLTGPEKAKRGETITYTATLSHTPESDKSEVCNVQLNSNLFVPRSLTFNGDNCLGIGETWQVPVVYQVPFTAPFQVINIGSVNYTTGDNIVRLTDESPATTIIDGASVEIVIQPSPISLTVGQKVTVTYQVTRIDDSSDPVNATLVLSSPVFGLAKRISGGDPLLKGQTWKYETSFTALTNTVHEQFAEVMAINQGSIIGSSEVKVTVIHQPELMLSLVSKEGQLYTFRIDHTSTSDKSPVSVIELNGQDYICTVVMPLSCTFTATIPLNAKIYEATIDYTTLDSENVLSQILRYDLMPNIYLPMIRIPIITYPVIALTKTGPSTAKPGDTIKYTFTLKHDLAKGTTESVCNINLSDPLIPNLSQTHTGDSDDNTCLNSDETWVYEANYTIPRDKTGSVDNTAIVTGKSAQSRKTVSASASLQIPIAPCEVMVVETFADSSSGWLTPSGPKVKWEYLNGQYVATSLDPTVLHFSTSPTKSVSADYVISVEANWNSPIGDEYGLVFNVVGSGDTASMYLFNINSQTGIYKLRRLLNGNYTTLSSGSSAQIKSGTAINTLQVQRTGNTFNLYVNGQLLGSASDSSLSASTKVGVDMLPSLSQKGQSAYDNFTICSDGGVQPAETDTSTQNATWGDINRP